MNVLVVERYESVQLSTEGNQSDAVLLPIIGVLCIADFSAPFSVKGISENRLEFGLSESIAQEILVEESVPPFSASDHSTYGRTWSHRTEAARTLCGDVGGYAGPEYAPASLGKYQVSDFRR